MNFEAETLDYTMRYDVGGSWKYLRVIYLNVYGKVASSVMYPGKQSFSYESEKGRLAQQWTRTDKTSCIGNFLSEEI